MCEVCRANPELADMETLMSSIQTAVKTIASLVARSHITGMVGAQGAVNVQGEEQKKLDVITNEVLKDALRFTGKMGVIASEEEDFPVDVLDDAALPEYDFETIIDETSRYIAVFDPLDGSSNVDAGVPTGTIFGIFEHEGEVRVVCEEELDDDCSPQQSVNESASRRRSAGLVARRVGVLPVLELDLLLPTLGAGVQMFVLDPLVGEFRLTHPNVKLPSRGSIYSLNEGNRGSWDAPLREYVSAIQDGRGESGKPYSSRYIGSMVGDVHRTLLYGGIFGYPADAKNPDGKLRLLLRGGADGVPGRAGGRPRAHGEDARDGPAAALGAPAGARAARLARRRARGAARSTRRRPTPSSPSAACRASSPGSRSTP